MKKEQKFKVGDLVEITSEVNGIYYSKGDRCIITEQESDGDYWGEFAGQSNARVYSGLTGERTIWCIGKPDEFRLVGGDK